MSLLGFGIGTMLDNFHMCGIMLALGAFFNMHVTVRNINPRGPMCFRCELLFLLCFITSWTRVVVSVMLYPCILCVSLLMDLFVLFVCCVFDNVCELFGETMSNLFECGCYFVVECYGV